MEKTSIPVDVHGSKTPLLKLPIISNQPSLCLWKATLRAKQKLPLQSLYTKQGKKPIMLVLPTNFLTSNSKKSLK